MLLIFLVMFDPFCPPLQFHDSQLNCQKSFWELSNHPKTTGTIYFATKRRLSHLSQQKHTWFNNQVCQMRTTPWQHPGRLKWPEIGGCFQSHLCGQRSNEDQLTTHQGIKISHLGNRKIIFKSTFKMGYVSFQEGKHRSHWFRIKIESNLFIMLLRRFLDCIYCIYC